MVFRAGTFGAAKPNVSSGTLFDPKWSVKDASRELDLSLNLCPPEEFSALWCAYEYYDVGEGREKEECSEVLRVGGAEGVVCPEVAHWYNCLKESLEASQEANPWRSASECGEARLVVVSMRCSRSSILFGNTGDQSVNLLIRGLN